MWPSTVWGEEEIRGLNKQGGSAWATWIAALSRVYVRDTGRAWQAFQRKRCASQALKDSRSYWQRLGLELAGIMEPNMQSQEMEKSQSREVGTLDREQGQMMLAGLQAG